MKENSAQAGFTLIEVLVVAILLGVFAAVATDTFSNIMKAQNKVRITNELEQSGNYVLSRIEQDVRNAERITCCHSYPERRCGGSVGVGLLVDGQDVRYLVWPLGGNVTAICRKVGEDGSCTYLTNTDPSSGVSVDTTSTRFECSTDEKRVSVTLALEPGPQAPLRSEFQGNVQLQTTTVLRSISY